MAEHPVILNPEGRFPGLIVVDHAGHALPDGYQTAGLAETWGGTHHFADLGIAPVAHRLAMRLDVPVVLGTVSRLVIDLNRWLDDPRSILSHAGAVRIPCNEGLDAAGRARRQDRIFWPYHVAVSRLWDRITARHANPLFLSLHSCTRHFDGRRRPWDGGTIWHESPALSRPLLDALGGWGDLILGDNQPYSGRDGIFTIDRHTWGGGVRACGFEISNDLLATEAGQNDWAERLDRALRQIALTTVQA